jgi:mRNA-degrading endonuclease RelE of RelBE toxin-antitoxin system
MWKVEYTKKFLKELASLPKEIQSRIEAIVFTELEIEKLQQQHQNLQNENNNHLVIMIILIQRVHLPESW